MNLLIVDIGSNSIRAMQVELADSGFDFFDKRVYTTRLAEGLLETGRLSDVRMAQSLDRLRALKREADALSVPLAAYATSAVRDAANREEFLDAAAAALGAPVEVLSGEEEARYAFLGATNGEGGLIDIGGGSTQIITGDYALSFPVGCVRAKDLCPAPSSFDQLRRVLKPALDSLFVLPALSADVWTGVGGTITTLAACQLGLTDYERARVHDSRLTHAQAANLLSALAKLGARRSRHPLLAERHDVILHGGAILLYIMEKLGLPEIRVSDADGMEGYAMQKWM